MYERRLLRLFFGIAALLVVVLLRTFQLQVLSADELLRAKADVVRSTSTVQPRRGEILWADGTPAVRNASRFVARVDTRVFDATRRRCGDCGAVVASKDLPGTCAECGAKDAWRELPPPDVPALAALLGVPPDALGQALGEVRETVRRRRWRAPDLFRDRRFSAETAAAVALRAADFPGVEVRAEPCRDADPDVSFLTGAAHVAWEEDVEALKSPERADRGLHVYTDDEARRTLVGHAGLELRHDEELRGVPGIVERRYARPGEPRPDPDVVRPVVDGTSIRLTLVKDLQRAAQEVVDATPAKASGAVLIDLRDGAILAMATHSDDLYFRPVVALIPGSVFKIVTALATLESGIDPSETLECQGRGRLRSGAKYTCDAVHGPLDLADAFARSCNLHFMQRAQDVGPAALRDAYARLGMGEDIRLGVGVSPLRPFVDRWNDATALLGIGQSRALATPLQVATAYARVATGGRRIVPFLERDLGPAPSSREVDPEIARFAPFLRDAAHRVVTEGTGSRIALLRDVDAAGKTGTAEVDVRGEGRLHNAWFVGYAPADAPRYLAVVVHERVSKMHGGELAGPGVARLLAEALRER